MKKKASSSNNFFKQEETSTSDESPVNSNSTAWENNFKPNFFIGVLLAVLGYGVGTYMAYICGLMLQAVAP